jgi:ABC-type branched-subunit amino acid transport system ATPase component
MFPRLEERRDQPAGTLSGGEQQMLAIGRCLAGQPELIMFDEPSLGLARWWCRTCCTPSERWNGAGQSRSSWWSRMSPCRS